MADTSIAAVPIGLLVRPREEGGHAWQPCWVAGILVRRRVIASHSQARILLQISKRSGHDSEHAKVAVTKRWVQMVNGL